MGTKIFDSGLKLVTASISFIAARVTSEELPLVSPLKKGLHKCICKETTGVTQSTKSMLTSLLGKTIVIIKKKKARKKEHKKISWLDFETYVGPCEKYSRLQTCKPLHPRAQRRGRKGGKAKRSKQIKHGNT